MSANDNNRNGNGSMNAPVAESSEPRFRKEDTHARIYRWRGESGTRHPVCNANCRQGS